MDIIIAILAPAVIGLVALTIIYRIVPAKNVGPNKPGFVLFPKYKMTIDDVARFKMNLRAMKFKEVAPGKFVRGHVLGDFIAKWAKLNVLLDEHTQTAQLYSPLVILFDTGDLWAISRSLLKKEA